MGHIWPKAGHYLEIKSGLFMGIIWELYGQVKAMFSNFMTCHT